jgi:hypothetical protein
MNLVIVNSHFNSGYLIQVMERVRNFCIQFESDANPDIFCEAVAEAYFRENPGLYSFAVVDDAGKVVAHAIVTVENYYGTITINIPQFWKDKGVQIPGELYDRFFELVIGLAKANKATKIRMSARNSAVARVLGRLGFKDTGRVVMQMEDFT